MRPIKGYEGLYSITESGDVISHPKPWVKKEKILKSFKSRNGYLYVTLGNKGKRKSIHSLVAEAYLIKADATLVVNHIDGNKSNNKLSNLEYVTYSENSKHSFKCLGRKGSQTYLGKRGKNHNKSKDFYLKDLSGIITHYESGHEFQRITGFSKETISYQRCTKIKSAVFKKGKLKGYTVYFYNPQIQ